MLMLVDQPLLKNTAQTEMLELFVGDRAICAFYAGQVGVPALFPRSLFSRLITLDGDSGARAMLHSVTDKITVPMPEAALDIDTVEDLKKL